jgi:hypothetical protein
MMMKTQRSRLLAFALPLFLSGSATGKPLDSANQCSKAELPSQQPSLFFIGRATAATRDVPVRGAGERLGESFTGSERAQLFDVDRIGGTDAMQLPTGTRRVLVVPWGYLNDCTPVKWSSDEWVETGTSGLVYGQLRPREHWVEGVPTIDTHNPHQLPYPRRPSRSTTAVDAFTLISLLPGASDLEARGTETLLPLAAWIRERPELAEGEPGRFLRSFLTQMTRQRIRDVEPEITGTYRFTLDLGDGQLRIFYGRTESHAVTPHRIETGTAFVDELRPPRAEGYALIVAVAGKENALPANRGVGGYGYVYVDLEPERLADGVRSWRAGAELTLVRHAFSDDVAVQQVARLDGGELRYFLEHNVPPGSDAAFRMLPDGLITFQQRYRLPDGAVAVLRAERISKVVTPSPR